MLKGSPNQMDDGWQRIPERSQLYCLEPIGKGTDLVESATSYLSRVSESVSCERVIA